MTAVENSRRSCECGSPQWRWGGRANELHERCERPERLVCMGCDAVRIKRCGRSSRVACVPCSESYRRRVRRVFASGWNDNPLARIYFLTLTAPGSSAHWRRDGQMCPCTPPGGVEPAFWNANARANWNRFMTYFRRYYGATEYACAVEVQRRGLLHFHALLRVTGHNARLAVHYGRLARKDPDSPLRLLAIRWGFGHAIDLQMVDPGDTRAAHYCSKYVSKSAAEREAMPWPDADGSPAVGNGRYRPWSSSRRWGLTMLAVKRAQAAWWSSEALRAAQAEPALPASTEQPGGAAGRQAGGALDSSSRSYTPVVRSGSPPPGGP